MHRKSQGAFEYILLLGGVLLIVVVSIIILRGSVLNQANQQVAGNVNAWQNTVCIPTYLGDSAAVGVWHFENDAQDSSGKENHGTLMNGATFGKGKHGKGINLTTTAYRYVRVEDSLSLDLTNAFTLEAWVKPNTGDNPVLGKEDGTALAYNMGTPAALMLYLNTDTLNPADWNYGYSVSMPSGIWLHIATTWDGTTVKYYEDGILKYTNPNSYTGTLVNSASALGIGKNGDQTGGNARYYAGLIDEAIIYNRALSQSEIQQDMNCAG